MRQVQTGKGTIPLITLIAILSISAMTSLPGLAISPILGDLDKIFPDTSDLKIQMLTSLPSLLIIPFVMLSGKLSESKNKLAILIIGLSIFLASGILYFFAKSMTALIFISCALGIGAGMIIPLSTGLIADFFIGEYRSKQLGISSAITNLTLVLATLLAGWLATFNWHYPFLVYLLPIFAIALSHYLSPKYITKEESITTNKKVKIAVPYGSLISDNKNYNLKLILSLIGIYFLATYLVLIVTFNIPFVIQEHHLSSSFSGILIALFFLAIMLPGFFINTIMKYLKNYIFVCSFLFIAIGLLLIALFHWFLMLALAVIFIGFGYGIIQPLIYDKTTRAAKPSKVFFALAGVMATNYLAILVSPFILRLIQLIFSNYSNTFPFIVQAIIAAIATFFAYRFRTHSLFANPQISSSINSNDKK